MTSIERRDTPRITVSTTYHGVTVTEEYRWLENATSEETTAWTAAQNAQTRRFLDGRPSYNAVRRRAEEIARAEAVSWGRDSYVLGFEGPRRAGAGYVVLKQEPPKQQPVLVALADLDDVSGARAVVDPNAVDETGATTIDWFVPSPDGQLVAVSLSSHGTEEGTLHLFRIASGEPVDVSIPRVNGGTAGGSLAWAGDSSGFWYTRGPAPGERPPADLAFFQEVWHHVIGAPPDRDDCDQPGPLADPRSSSTFSTRRLTGAGSWIGLRRATAASGRCSSARRRAASGGKSPTYPTDASALCSAAAIRCICFRAKVLRAGGCSGCRSRRESRWHTRNASSPRPTSRSRGSQQQRPSYGCSTSTVARRACASATRTVEISTVSRSRRSARSTVSDRSTRTTWSMRSSHSPARESGGVRGTTRCHGRQRSPARLRSTSRATRCAVSSRPLRTAPESR